VLLLVMVDTRPLFKLFVFGGALFRIPIYIQFLKFSISIDIQDRLTAKTYKLLRSPDQISNASLENVSTLFPVSAGCH
jgi:hypothetical protein